MRTVEYKVVRVKEVNDWLLRGWLLYGSPVSFASDIHQALTKVIEI